MTWLWIRTIWTDRRGQDLIEYALMASVVAIAAGAVFPPISDTIGVIMSKVTSVLARPFS